MLTSEHADVVREAVRLVIAELIEVEVASSPAPPLRTLAQRATPAQQLPPAPVGHARRPASSWRSRRLRSGSFFRASSSRGRHSEQAPRRRRRPGLREQRLNAQGRAPRRPARHRGIEPLRRSSRLCPHARRDVRIFREHPLEGPLPLLWLDAKVEHVREAGSVRHKASCVPPTACTERLPSR